MRKKTINLWKTLTAVTFLGISSSFAQLAPETYYVQFTDKAGSTFSVSNPSAFLSQRAIDRRNAQGISVTTQDLPVNQNYIDSVLSKGAINLKYPLKWFNGVVIQSTDTAALMDVWNLPFVDASKSVQKSSKTSNGKIKNIEEDVFPLPLEKGSNISSTLIDYGAADNQNTMITVDLLHDAGYTGQGMLIAVFDAGFYGVDTLNAFQDLWANNQIVDQHDFVDGGDIQYNKSLHGMQVLSTMGGNLPGELVGTAPDASYALFRTEDGGSEFLIEEYNWVAGAEYADSIGADVFNTSLGYTTFNDPSQNHTYADMNGDIAPITIGADIAASKGVLVVNSAGNSGGSIWHYIGAPADGDSVLAIGAVNPARGIAGFSSRGPSFDGRVKPNVCAQGELTSIYTAGNVVVQSNGTSFSGPVLAGGAACLWQSSPTYSSMEIFAAIEESAHLSSNPNDDFGYGIPNLFLASYLVTGTTELLGAKEIAVYPNPASSFTNILLPQEPSNVEIIVTDINGRVVEQVKQDAMQESYTLNTDSWNKGIYIVKVILSGEESTYKLVVR